MSWTSFQRELQLRQGISARTALGPASVCRLLVHSNGQLREGSLRMHGGVSQLCVSRMLLGGSHLNTCQGCTL